MNRLKLFIPLGIFVLLASLFLVGLKLDPNELPSELVGRQVPAFSLPSLMEPEKTITPDQLRGKPYLLNIWGTWCPACIQEHPYLVKLAKQGVAIYGVNYRDEPEEARKLLQRMGDPYVASIVDEDGTLGLDLGVTGAPETFVVDADGVVRYRLVGVVNESVWTSTLAPLYTGSP